VKLLIGNIIFAAADVDTFQSIATLKRVLEVTEYKKVVIYHHTKDLPLYASAVKHSNTWLPKQKGGRRVGQDGMSLESLSSHHVAPSPELRTPFGVRRARNGTVVVINVTKIARIPELRSHDYIFSVADIRQSLKAQLLQS